MGQGRRLLAALLLFIGSAYAFAASAPDPIPHLLSADYAAVERLMQAVQNDYKRDTITDEALLAAFRPFYFLEQSQAHHLDRWIKSYPKSYVAHLARGIYYKHWGFDHPRYDSGDKKRTAMKRAHDRAAQDLYASMDLDDKPLLSYFHSIDISGWVGRRPQRLLLNAANAIDPDNFIVRHEFLLALLPNEGGSIEEMRAFVADSEHSLAPEQVRRLQSTVMFAEAQQALRGRNDPTQAERLYLKVLEFDPDSDMAAWYLLYVLVNQKRCTEAIAVATRLLDRPDARAGEVLARRGWCYLQQDQSGEGVEDWQRAAELGDVWAQKELSGLYWFGKHVPRDVERARHWMQKAAEQGEEDAEREMQRSFGVTIASSRPQTTPPWVTRLGILAAVVVAFVLVIGWEHKERVAALDARLMRYPPIYLVLGLGGSIGFGYAAWIGYWSGYLPWRSAAFLVPAVLAALSLYLLVRRLTIRHALLADGALFRGYVGRETRLKWVDLHSIRYNPFMQGFRLEAKTGDVVLVPTTLMGLNPFARALLVHAEHAIADDRTRGVLEEMAEDWEALDEAAVDG
jgi:tetratricopeptide (TPR) repeat protein